MEIGFLKMHGLGNDYVFIDCFKHPIPEEQHLFNLAKKISHRNFGVGGDGLVLILPGAEHNIRMRMFNADGSEAEMCGNAIRCIGRYAFDSGIATAKQFPVETMLRTIELTIIDSRHCKVDMGPPYTDDNRSEIRDDPKTQYDRSVIVDGHEYTYIPVSMGNPHAVLFVPDYRFDLHDLGRKIEHHSNFPNRTNVEFVQVFNREEIKMRVWERGSGETLACGTGASAAMVASFINGFTDREVLVHLKGGDLFVEWSKKNNRVFMTGPADYVFTGTYYFEEREHTQ